MTPDKFETLTKDEFETLKAIKESAKQIILSVEELLADDLSDISVERDELIVAYAKIKDGLYKFSEMAIE